MRPLLLLSLLVASVSTGCVSLSPLPAQGTFFEREVDIDGHVYRYQVFAPARATAGDGKPPVVLFLHGSGERGDDNRRQAEVGLGPYVRAHADTFPAIVVLPQAPEGREWGEIAPIVFAQLDAATREFRGDPARTLLTGMSMGGYGTWDYAMRAPERFAALVPVCGGVVHPRRPSMNVSGVEDSEDPYATVAQRIQHIPVWIFHGAKDDVVLPEYSRRMAAALRAAGADVRYTEFPDANHNSWDPAYAQTPELWDWVFRQARRAE
jgi:predicted peptidase